MKIDLFDSLNPDTLVLTANQRLADFLCAQFNKWQQTNDKSPTNIIIHSFSHWLQITWQYCVNSQLIAPVSLLSDVQTHAIWEEIIRQSSQGTLLLNTSATTKLAIEAWSLINNWQITIDHPYFAFNEDTRVWQQWAKTFNQRCHDQHYIDNSKIIDYLIPIIQSNNISLHKNILLVGFHELNPQQNKLFNAIKLKQCMITQRQLNTVPSIRKHVALADTQTELRTMARWAKNCFEKNPHSKIACIVPQLSELKNQIQSIFTEIFAPQNLLPLGENISLPFSITGGQPLSTYPLIHIALQIIGLAHKQISITEISTLIRSPFIGGADLEMSARALCDIKMREIGSHTLSLKQIFNVVRNMSGCEILAKQLQQYMSLINHDTQSSAAWHMQFAKQLAAFHWPGDVKLTSYEFQLVQQWQNLLKEFANLDKFISHLSYSSALHQLHSLAKQQIYLPEAPEHNIQIINILEASGMIFDHLWIMGLDEMSWPAKTQTNSFVPMRLQRELSMPHSSAQQEWHFAQQLTSQFLQSAETIIFSHSSQNNDRELSPSALIKSVPTIDINELSLTDDFSLSRQIFQSAEFEYFIDHKAPPVLPDEKIKGGTALIKNQAACPFRAFALYRLNALPMAEAVMGLPAFERGNLVHRILEKFWQTTHNHHTLSEMSEEKLKTTISAIISATLKDLRKQYSALLGQRFLNIEQYRLTQLIYRWLEWEKTRKPFTVIATEKKYNFVLGQINIQMQVDRIDQLENDQYAIIDYKTSKISLQHWFGDRPDEPQLPLYCIASVVPINTIAFAQIRTDGINCSTLGETTLAHNDRTTKVLSAEQWLEQKIHWTNTLTQLSEEFSQGIAHVHPKHGVNTCELCHLSAVCRIYE